MDAEVLLEMTGAPAFASDDAGRIVGWNAAVQRLLGYAAKDVLGKPCFQVTCGIDTFGNSYCGRDCNPRQMLARREPISGFKLDVRTACGERIPVEFSILPFRSGDPPRLTLVHLLRATHPCAEGCAPRSGGSLLSPREHEVLLHLAEGRSVAEISLPLAISEYTVRTHIENIFNKLDAHNRLQAVAIARRRGLI